MGRFDRLIAEIRSSLAGLKAQGPYREFPVLDPVPWPPAGPRDIVLLPDLALELGHPEEASLCFLVWSEDQRLIRNQGITLIGPDIHETTSRRLPLAKIVLAAVDPVDEAAAYDRYRAMDLARFELALKGYMLRATSQYLREWSRVSREAVQNGFGFQILGSALIGSLKTITGVRGAEVLFVTCSAAAVAALQPIGVTAGRMIQAMNKMLAEHDADCRNCEFQDVCTQAADLQALARTLAARKASG
jgi:CO dehydrogenase/acetyl-CoA synthase beta subunit